ncbi:hypothetical protein CTI14_50010, partial [Methylobacterium radiotolerans]
MSGEQRVGRVQEFRGAVDQLDLPFAASSREEAGAQRGLGLHEVIAELCQDHPVRAEQGDGGAPGRQLCDRVQGRVPDVDRDELPDPPRHLVRVR